MQSELKTVRKAFEQYGVVYSIFRGNILAKYYRVFIYCIRLFVFVVQKNKVLWSDKI